MSEVMREPVDGPVEVPVVNPWAFCTECCGNIDARAAGRNLPCGCVADVGSACPTWDLWFGCRCSYVDPDRLVDVDEFGAASALQEALEDQERLYLPDLVSGPALRVVDGTGGWCAPSETALRGEEPGDAVLEQAGRWRAVLGWAALLGALLMLLGLWSAGGPW